MTEQLTPAFRAGSLPYASSIPYPRKTATARTRQHDLLDRLTFLCGGFLGDHLAGRVRCCRCCRSTVTVTGACVKGDTLMRTLLLAVACTVALPSAARAVVLDMVTVGNVGNRNDQATGNLYGAVPHEYQIGKFEVTIGQYCDFLNAVARDDVFNLYHDGMETSRNTAGILRSGVSGDYLYSVMAPSNYAPPGASSPRNRPITFVTWFDAARFANWMHNGQPLGAQGPGTTETGAYTLEGATSGIAPAKNVGAQFYIPTENEWYKAAYYSPVLNSGSGGYYAYATQSDSPPGNLIGSDTNQANYWRQEIGYCVTQGNVFSPDQNYLSDVGAFVNSGSYYGTFDQTGNLAEWNDLISVAAFGRGVRGGRWNTSPPYNLSSQFSRSTHAAGELVSNTGFRLAAPIAVPEPSTCAMALASLTCGGYSMFRRRRAR